jgi:hypothetical protein
MALDATVSGADANSYVSLAVAELYFTDRIAKDEWEAADEGERERALVTACRRLEVEEYVGCITDSDQALQWPRLGIYDRNGRLLASDTIPAGVQAAQCELALAMLQDPTLSGGGDLNAFENVQLGSMNVTPRRSSAGSLPQSIKQMLAFVLAAGMGTPVIRA